MKLIIFFTLFICLTTSTPLKIYIFKVGQADSQLVLFPSGYSILIDAGEPADATGESGTNGKYLAKRLHKILGKTKIDVFVLTHFHWDHHGGYGVGGIWYLIEKAGFSFTKFIHRNIGTYKGSKLANCNKDSIQWKYVGPMPAKIAQFVCYATSQNEKTKLSRIGQLARRCSTTQITPPDADSEVKIIIRDALGVNDSNGTTLARNSMNEEHPVNENDFCLCLRIVFGKFVYVACGDLSGREIQFETKTNIYHNVESAVAPMIGEVDVYHVNHHGSRTSTNKKWCKTLKPTVAVSSCGDDGVGVGQTPMTNLKSVNATVYTTSKATGAEGKSLYNEMIRMDDDIVIKVPHNGTEFAVMNSKGENKRVFPIKMNKKEPQKCHALEKDE